METCGILTYNPQIVGYGGVLPNSVECLRPRGHAGEHLYCDYKERYIATCLDLLCDSEWCHSEDMNDWCEMYREVTRSECERLLTDPAFALNLDLRCE